MPEFLDEEDEIDESFEPTGTDVSAGNKIIELDPNEELTSDRPGSDPDRTAFMTEEMSRLADMLSEVGADDESALIEIERRHMVDNEDHTIRFTAKELTEIAIHAAIARTVAHYHGDRDSMSVVKHFGQMVKRNVDAPMAAGYEDLEFSGLVPGDGQGDHVDPFRAIEGNQYLHLTDENDEMVPLNEPERLAFYDEERADEHRPDPDSFRAE